MKINEVLTGIKQRTILTSKGFPTVEVDLITSRGVYRSSCPSGTSKGTREAMVLVDGGEPYNGRGVEGVLRNIRECVSEKILGLSCNINEQESIDRYLLELDGTQNKSKIGANAMTPLSVAFCKAGADHSGKSVDEFISCLSSSQRGIPTPHFNILNGGAHSGNNMDVQEIMVAYPHGDLRANVESVCVLYEALGSLISERYGAIHTCVGDEGGFAPPVETLEEGLDLVLEASSRCNRTNMRIAIDLAANEFAGDRGYVLDGRTCTTGELCEYYVDVVGRYPQVYSLEDPFSEQDHDGWRRLTAEIGSRINVVGDDLTVTDPELVEDAGLTGLCNTLLVKPNQVGTVTETLRAVSVARRHGMKIMVSHRSGDTEDCFISDLAVGIGAEYIKAGAPCRGERVAKYNQLLRLDEH